MITNLVTAFGLCVLTRKIIGQELFAANTLGIVISWVARVTPYVVNESGWKFTYWRYLYGVSLLLYVVVFHLPRSQAMAKANFYHVFRWALTIVIYFPLRYHCTIT